LAIIIPVLIRKCHDFLFKSHKFVDYLIADTDGTAETSAAVSIWRISANSNGTLNRFIATNSGSPTTAPSPRSHRVDLVAA
jgi:hypothetical protein